MIRGLLIIWLTEAGDEPASELLKRIRKEKERLAEEGKIAKEKPLPPIKEEEKPFELPRGWEWVRLEEICTQITDGTHYTPNYADYGIPFLSVKDISKGTIDFSNTRFISIEDHNKLASRCRPELGDILLTKVGTTGIAVAVETTKEFSIFVSVALLKLVKALISQLYIVYVLNSPFVKSQSEKYTMGVGNQNLVLKYINKFMIPFPPLKEQLRIIIAIESLMSRCDSLEMKLFESKRDHERWVEAVLAG